MIRAVLFDLGDTLIRFDHADLTAVFRQSARHSYDVLKDRIPEHLPTFTRYHLTHLFSLRWKYLKSKFTGREFDSTDVLRACSKRLGLPVSDDFYDELAWQWYKPLAKASHVESDAVETLRVLQARGLELAIVSNTFVPGSALDRHLDQTGLLPFFPLRVYSCDLGIRKPRKEIFLHALHRLRIPVSDALFVGDQYRLDILGATRIGMTATWKSPHSVPRKLGPGKYHITRLSELPELIEQLNRDSAKETP